MRGLIWLMLPTLSAKSHVYACQRQLPVFGKLFMGGCRSTPFSRVLLSCVNQYRTLNVTCFQSCACSSTSWPWRSLSLWPLLRPIKELNVGNFLSVASQIGFKRLRKRCDPLWLSLSECLVPYWSSCSKVSAVLGESALLHCFRWWPCCLWCIRKEVQGSKPQRHLSFKLWDWLLTHSVS